ncbi:MAG: (2Fe-2S)-binding protein [Deltaproteobacteria bacterium]|nr:(2Fe-2S)-binding protein [Deltaproteobacteria bacterium]
MIDVKCRLNGKEHTLRGHSMARLLDVIREEAKLTGTKEGCGEGECGACSVLIDGVLVDSCLVPLAQVQGAEITTIEGVAHSKHQKLQQAFIEHGGAQCGICTPGMIIASAALIDRCQGRVPNTAEVREALAGNLCRCTGYMKIIDAVQAAAKP